MTGRSKNIILIAVVLGFFFFLMFTRQEPKDWVPTWHESDKDPYGGYVLHQVLQKRTEVSSEYRGLYELQTQYPERIEGKNLLLITSGFNLDENDIKALISHVKSGNRVMMAADFFGRGLYDSLGIGTSSMMIEEAEDVGRAVQEVTGEASVKLRFELEDFPTGEYEVKAAVADNFFKESDSIPYRVLARVEGKEMARAYSIGKGELVVVNNPLLLSNYYILDSTASEFTAGLLSFLPSGEPVVHVEYYQMGRMESRSPLRYILSEASLRTAVYLALIAIALFMLFEAKRRQRIIPVIEPPKNSSVEFTKTLGQLYYKSRKDHQNMARKRVSYLLEYIRSRYYMSTEKLDADFEQELVRRSGKDKDRIAELLKLVRQAQAGVSSKVDFLVLEKLLDRFYATEPGNDG